VFLLNRFGLFVQFEAWLAGHVSFLSWLHPESLGIVALQLTAEISAGLAAELITYNQIFRIGSIILVGVFYYFLTA
jgi:hypothetical protein